MLERNEDAQISSVGEALVLRFDGQLSRETVLTEVASTRELFSNARIRTYVPVLIQREAFDSLRREIQHSADANAA
jgi:hypothetical protein